MPSEAERRLYDHILKNGQWVHGYSYVDEQNESHEMLFLTDPAKVNETDSEILRFTVHFSRDEYRQLLAYPPTEAAAPSPDAELRELRARLIMYENTLKDMKEYLSSTWDAAKEEIFSDNNFGWTMVAKEAIRLRVAAGIAAREDE